MQMSKNLLIAVFVLMIILSSPTALIFSYNNQEVLSSGIFPDQLEDGYEGVYLKISKSKNTLSIYLNGSIVQTFRVATGKEELTPIGSFKIITKVIKPWYLPKNIPGGDKTNPLGTRWLGLNVGNTGGYKYGIHGTNNPYSIGQNISSGCIRMLNKDVEWLFRHIPLNTLVIITE